MHWPLSVIRISSSDYTRLIDLADHILSVWRAYTDEDAFIYAETDGEPHYTITPIVRMRGEMYELDFTLRNNIMTKDSPLGVYHPRAEYHNIKKENIGLIEVMGLAVLPARLDKEMQMLEKCLVENIPVIMFEELVKHDAWAKSIRDTYRRITWENVHEILEKEIGESMINPLKYYDNNLCGTKRSMIA